METGKMRKSTRKLPKLKTCMSRASKENMQNALMFSVVPHDSREIRRHKKPLYKCLLLEMKEMGYVETSNFLQNILYDNAQLVEEDEIGIVVDLRKRDDYLEDICAQLKQAERNRERDRTKEESQVFLNLGLKYAEFGKGLLWLAEKFFLASIAVANQYSIDGGRWRGICMYHYAKFLLDKFPDADSEEAYQYLTKVRDSCIGKTWLLEDPEEEQEKKTEEEEKGTLEEEGKESPTAPTLLKVVCLQLCRVLLSKARQIRQDDPGKAERLSRLAERRASDAEDFAKCAEALTEVGVSQLMMNNLNNALKTFQRALLMNEKERNIEGQCVTRMHIAAAMQRLGDHETAASMLTTVGLIAMEHGYRKHLGRALHLLGELHLRTDTPELGTQHLCEAFSCFMGISNVVGHPSSMLNSTENSSLEFKNFKDVEGADEIFYEEAEQSRLMAAVSSGQELMGSYFNLLREAKTCSVAKAKIIDWKLLSRGWWISHKCYDFIPCPCSVHNRSPLDIVNQILELRKEDKNAVQSESSTDV